MNDETARPAPDDGILFLNEYQYENDLLANLARLEATPARRGTVGALSAAVGAGGVALLATAGAWAWAGLPAIAVAAVLGHHAIDMRHSLARQHINAMEHATGSFADRYRRVAVSAEGVMVFARDGRTRYYALDKLSRVLSDDLMHVLLFDEEGVVVPRAGYLRGSADELDAFLAGRTARRRR